MRAITIVTTLWVVCGLAAAVPAGAAEPDSKTDQDAPCLPLKGLKVAVLTGEQFQSTEALMPIAMLTNRGAEVLVIGPSAGKAKCYDKDLHLLVHAAAADVSADDFDALVIPGGYAPRNIRKDEAVLDFTRAISKAGKPIAAICHGPQVLATADVIEGRTMTCFSGVSAELTDAGATYKDEPVIRDGNLVTSRLPKDIPVWLATMETVLTEYAEKVKKDD
ncbi:MAG: DJ-1/PfpI/YhbO family deglycase/protease [Planctomycetota bacterium]